METLVFYTKEGESLSTYTALKEKLQQEGSTYADFIQKGHIKMVGSYMFSDGTCWFSFPKYFKLDLIDHKPSENDMNKLKIIIQVLEKLRADGKNLYEGDHIFDADIREKNKRRVNILDLSTYIVKDYIQNGLFVKTSKAYFKNGKGRVSWAKTISKNNPIINNGNIIYSSLWKKRNVVDENDIISNIHAEIVCKAIEIYEKYNFGNYIKKPDCWDMYDEDRSTEYTKLLNMELLQVFSDREQSILKALIAWCDSTVNYKMAGCTNCFQNVWEWVNDAVFGNKSDKNEKESEHPTYVLVGSAGNETSYIGLGQAKPDTIFFSVDKDNYYLYVYDSKYYVPKFSYDKSKKEIYGYPANSDIVKQVAYMRRMQESFHPITEKLITKNIFLLPEIEDDLIEIIGDKKEDDELYQEIGYVVQANFDEMAKRLVKDAKLEIELEKTNDQDKVYLYMVYCSKLYDMYLKNKQYNPVR